MDNKYAMSIPEGYIRIRNSGPNPASLITVLRNSGAPAHAIVLRLVQRLREVKPNSDPTTDRDVIAGITIGGGQTVYVFGPNDGAPDFQVTNPGSAQPTPPTYVPGVNADGNVQNWANGSYQFSYALSSGFNNLLADVVLRGP